MPENDGSIHVSRPKGRGWLITVLVCLLVGAFVDGLISNFTKKEAIRGLELKVQEAADELRKLNVDLLLITFNLRPDDVESKEGFKIISQKVDKLLAEVTRTRAIQWREEDVPTFNKEQLAKDTEIAQRAQASCDIAMRVAIYFHWKNPEEVR